MKMDYPDIEGIKRIGNCYICKKDEAIITVLKILINRGLELINVSDSGNFSTYGETALFMKWGPRDFPDIPDLMRNGNLYWSKYNVIEEITKYGLKVIQIVDDEHKVLVDWNN